MRVQPVELKDDSLMHVFHDILAALVMLACLISVSIFISNNRYHHSNFSMSVHTVMLSLIVSFLLLLFENSEKVKIRKEKIPPQLLLPEGVSRARNKQPNVSLRKLFIE